MPTDASDSVHAFEPPIEDRPATAAPTQPEVEQVALEHDPYAALRFRNYRFYVASYSIAVVGGQIQTAAIDWELYQRTHSKLLVGGIGFVQFLPVFLLALVAGQAADIFNRRRILLLTQLALAFWGLAMAVNSYFLGSGNHVHAFAATALIILFLNSVTLAFARPARASMLPHVVPQHLFPNAATWNSSMFELASTIGPAIGGFMIGLGAPWAYFLNALLLLVCFLVTFPLPDVKVIHKKPAVCFASLLAGVRFVWKSDLLIATLTMDLLAVLLGGATYLLPIFAQDILHVGSVGYGWMRAAPAMGAICMAMLVAHMPPMKRAGRNLLLAVAGFGAATIVFGLSKSYWLSLAMLFLTGAFDNISVIVRHTLVQLLTPDEMRGRVSAVNQVFIGSSNDLGGFESGVTAQLLGPVASVVMGGIGTVLVVLGVASVWPQLRKLGALHEVNPAQEPTAQTNK